MADNVTLTAGAGTTIWTDEVSGSKHAQVVKLADGTADGTAVVGATTDRGLYVQPRRSIVRVQVTPVIDTNIYASGDCLGALTTVADAALISGGGGFIRGIQVVDKTQAQRAAMTALFYSQSVTMAGNNSPFAASDADQLFLVAQVEILSTHYNTAWPGTPLNSVATVPHNDAASTPILMEVPYVCAATSLFMQLVVRGTPTYTSTSDLVVGLILDRH